MQEITRGVFGQLDITSPTDVDQRVAYINRVLRGDALNKYKAVLLEWNQSAEDTKGDKCTLGELKGISTENFCTWDKIEGVGYEGDAYLWLYNCVKFNKELWFELGKEIWRKHRRVFQEHLKYICNDIVKPFRVRIIHYTECVQEMHDLAKHLHTP